MPKSHRAIQQWDHWLTEPLGKRLLAAERNFLPSLLNNCYGKHALLIGVPNQISLLRTNTMPHQILLTPLMDKNQTVRVIEGNYYDLPFASASIDLVLLPHTLEHIDNPHKALSEACRVVKMEGLIIICGLNPLSLWGLKRKLTKDPITPWAGNFLSPGTVKKWLALSDFELIKQEYLFFRPPVTNKILYDRFIFLEGIGRFCWKSLGGIYMLTARAKGIPLTPIKVHWKQQLSGVRASFSGPNMGHIR